MWCPFVGLSYPAGPAGSLVPDLFDCGTVRPLLARVEAVGKPYAFSIVNPEEERTITDLCR